MHYSITDEYREVSKVNFVFLAEDLSEEEQEYLEYVEENKCCFEEHETFGLNYFIDSPKVLAYRLVW